jgi:predicted DNA-binding protein YlxM (UPF0122 family)
LHLPTQSNTIAHTKNKPTGFFMIAVLTGDLVNSTKMSQEQYTKVLNNLKGLLKQTAAKYNANGEIYRGDEFQIHYPDPAQAIKSTLLIKLALYLSSVTPKPLHCTLSLAFGHFDTFDSKPNTSSGPVYISSGRGLGKTPRGELSLHFEQQSVTDDIHLATNFLNHLINRLTKSQAELLFQYIENDFAEHKKIAQLTGTTRQNISNRLSNIGAFLVKDYITTINKKLMLPEGHQ